jgi:hypothetical protein
MRYSNIILLNNIHVKLCLYDSEKRFRNGHTAPPIFVIERIHGNGKQNSWSSAWRCRGFAQVGPAHGDVVGGCTVYYTILYTLMPAVFGKIAVENSWLNQI